MLAVTNPGDEVIVFEPYYENYGPDTLLCDAKRKLVSLRPPDWTFDPDELRRAFSPRTKAIILNSPNNPTGRVFTRAELQIIAELCQEFDALTITDEIYEHILVRLRVSRTDSDIAGNAGTQRFSEQHEQDLLGNRMAGGVGAGRAGFDRVDSKSTRFLDRGRRRTRCSRRAFWRSTCRILTTRNWRAITRLDATCS